MRPTASSLRSQQEVGDKFDVYTVLAKSPLFVKYPKTLGGLISFWQTELQPVNLTTTPDSFVLTYANTVVSIPTIDFLQILTLPLYHCTWDDEAQLVIEEIANGILTARVNELARSLFQAKAIITIDMIPNDWQDLVEELIASGKMDLSKFKTVDEVEQAVDATLYPSNTEAEVEYEAPPPQMMREDKEILARTLNLDVCDFETKEEALKIYESRR